jgi:hypothetical protein
VIEVGRVVAVKHPERLRAHDIGRGHQNRGFAAAAGGTGERLNLSGKNSAILFVPASAKSRCMSYCTRHRCRDKIGHVPRWKSRHSNAV